MTEQCIFCRIINGEIPSEKIYEDSTMIAIKDIRPVAPIHILLIPRAHIPSMNEVEQLPDETIANMFKLASRIARAQNIAEDGYRIVVNAGRGGGQQVMHLHIHLLGGRTMGKMG